jgi:hypothetical protein
MCRQYERMYRGNGFSYWTRRPSGRGMRMFRRRRRRMMNRAMYVVMTKMTMLRDDVVDDVERP